MTFVVTESCIRCKYTDCVTVCPVDCFHEGPNFLVIDPDVCIDCAVCVPECPVNAIVADHELKPEQHRYVDLNARYSRQWPVITESREPLPDAQDWADVSQKFEQLQT